MSVLFTQPLLIHGKKGREEKRRKEKKIEEKRSGIKNHGF
jgi:hypothetical protein